MAINLLFFISRLHVARSFSVVYGDGDAIRRRPPVAASSVAALSVLEAVRRSAGEQRRGGILSAIWEGSCRLIKASGVLPVLSILSALHIYCDHIRDSEWNQPGGLHYWTVPKFTRYKYCTDMNAKTNPVNLDQIAIFIFSFVLLSMIPSR